MMHRALLTVLGFAAAIPYAAPARAAGVTLDGQTFTLPDGCVIERIASTELSKRPVHVDFDDQGRLYVAESSGSNDPVNQQLEEKPHSILRLEDSDGDGVFDRRTVFADKMMFPAGVLWHGGSVYVTAPPQIWKLTDTTGDGVADQREVWLDPGTLTGCANDLHGPFLGRDGWIYWCKGAFAKQEFEQTDGRRFESRAAHIFRRHPSGGGVEVVMTGGMDNPVELVTTPAGDRLFTSTFMLHPGGGKRDGIGHAAYGAMFGKLHDPLDSHHRTSGSLNEPIVHLGSAAPAGLHYSESAAFGESHRGSLYAALFNLHKISRHKLLRDGASFRTEDEDFLISDSSDFHPTDVLEDADGSLIVVDTGGWYKLCCPTSQLYKPDVLGGIYRIRKQDMPRAEDPRGLSLPWADVGANELARRLEDVRPYVRQRTVAALARRGAEAVDAVGRVLRESRSVDARTAAVWALARIEDDAARTLTTAALSDPDDVVRQAALSSVALWRQRDALPDLIALLKSGTPAQRLVAAEAVGRIGDATAVAPLIEAMDDVDSPRQALSQALIEIGNADAIRETAADEAALPIGALIALDQLGKATAADVLPLLNAPDETARAEARWILGRRPEWAGELGQQLLGEAGDLRLNQHERLQMLAAYAGNQSVQEVLARAAQGESGDRTARELALAVMAAEAVAKPPTAWADAITNVIKEAQAGGGDPSLLSAAVRAARACAFENGPPDLAAALLDAGGDPSLPYGTRMMALASIPAGGALPEPLFAAALESLGSAHSFTTRKDAAEVLRRAVLAPDQLDPLISRLKDVGPLELETLLGIFAAGGDGSTGTALVAALSDAGAKAAIRPDTLRSILEKFPASVLQTAQPLLAALEPDREEQQAKMEQLLEELEDGDVRRGQKVFNSSRAACSACHAIGYLGGNLGPDLTRIGAIRSRRDLLEAILFPSASLVRSYETVVVTTSIGQVHSGFLKEERHGHITLATGPEVTVMLPRESIVEMQESRVSLMPPGLHEQISRQELADLIAFLSAAK